MAKLADVVEATAIRALSGEHSRSGSHGTAQAHQGDAVPEKETVADFSQGVQLAFIQALAQYWATDYDWRRCEAQAERSSPIRHRDRRVGYPFHSRPFKT